MTRRYILGWALAWVCWALPASTQTPRPKLVVVISVDQLSADLMQRWSGTWRGGLASLQKDGVDFAEAYHAHGIPKTAPGHAVLLSGRHPARTGIAGNNWLDRESLRSVESVEDPAARTLGKAEGPGSGPRHFRGSTLGEWLKAQVPGSRSYAVAGKARAAILMAGAKADGVYWFEPKVGFTTSTAYAPALPDWLVRHDAALLRRLKGDSLWWSPLAPIPQGQAQTGSWRVGNRTLTGRLPLLINGAGMPLDGDFWDRLKESPYLDEATLDAALALVETQRLGRGPATDLLAVGLSATDFVGHTFGNAGEEMVDQLRRLDQWLGAFLAKVRAQVPGAWFVLTADHGAEDFPERLESQGFPAKRLAAQPWLDTLRARLRQQFQVEGDPLRAGSTPSSLYPNDRVLSNVGATRADMLKAVAEVVKGMPEVVDAVTGPELTALLGEPETSPDVLSMRAQLALSYVPFRSGDILVAFPPHRVWDGPPDEPAASHGAPYDYDRRVPLIFCGPWRPERRAGAVRTVDLAATLAEQLGLMPDAPLDGKPLPLRKRK